MKRMQVYPIRLSFSPQAVNTILLEKCVPYDREAVCATLVGEDGEEVERAQVNSSSYKMVPRSATVGTATDDPVAYEQIMAAIGTGSIDHVKNVIAALQARATAANAQR